MGRGAELEALLREMRARGASDLHLAPGSTPRLRLEGELIALPGPQLTAEDVQVLCAPVLAEAQRRTLDDGGDVSIAFEAQALGRFRVCLFRRAGALGAVFRAIPSELPRARELGLPAAALALCERSRGLVLVTGPTGSGRSTTLAAMVSTINADRRRHIVTIEDPVEHVHTHAQCLVSQRQIGSDARSVARAVRAALRQDPDVVVIGELSDAEGVDAALTAAEAGHLCLAAAHGASAVQALTHLIDLFPVHRQTTARGRLALALESVLNQRLIPRATGGGRVLAVELLIPGAADRALIRDDNLPALYPHMQASPDATGMQTLNRSLAELYLAREITLEAAIGQSADPNELQQLIAAHGQPPPRKTGPMSIPRRS
jgi:twitching motility protein PilT